MLLHQRDGFPSESCEFIFRSCAMISLTFAIRMGTLLITSIILMRRAFLDSNANNVWIGGFLSVDPNAIFTGGAFDGGDDKFLLRTLLINLPQLLFSFLYYTYNGIFTAMHVAEEWAGYAVERKTLRVSKPRAQQRSTYWLNLPWTYSVPLLLLSALLHWLVSRSLYLVSIRTLGPDGLPQPWWDISACGFSPLAMVLVVVILIIMTSFLVFCSHLKLEAKMPMVGTASAAISAACHHPNDTATEACKPIQWGVTRRATEEKPGHCAFSSGPVEEPVEGKYYT